ncbi:hypothetical protein GGR50DRAFT_698937 [Xylaria sp. CBS 124048]|nr:hypothetical protein GGR50DRAFT_698937 [Xylaria sp. CBS 124048]
MARWKGHPDSPKEEAISHEPSLSLRTLAPHLINKRILSILDARMENYRTQREVLDIFSTAIDTAASKSTSLKYQKLVSTIGNTIYKVLEMIAKGGKPRVIDLNAPKATPPPTPQGQAQAGANSHRNGQAPPTTNPAQGPTYPLATPNSQIPKQPVAPTNAKSYANAAAGHTTLTATTKTPTGGKNKKAGPTPRAQSQLGPVTSAYSSGFQKDTPYWKSLKLTPEPASPRTTGRV